MPDHLPPSTTIATVANSLEVLDTIPADEQERLRALIVATEIVASAHSVGFGSSYFVAEWIPRLTYLKLSVSYLFLPRGSRTGVTRIFGLTVMDMIASGMLTIKKGE